MEELWKKYGYYLMDEINFHNKKWEKVLFVLHDIDFTSIIPMDDNRVNDGIYERKCFIRNMGLDSYIFEDYDASVLEVLVALVKRICDEYVWAIDYNGDDMRYVVLEAFLINLGLSPSSNREKICENVFYWMEREYGEDGKYSIMPLPYKVNGYNFIEIWNQVGIFLTENDIKSWEDFDKFL